MQSENKIWQKTLLNQKSDLESAIRCLNLSSQKIVLVIDDAGVLLATISDGDIRRGLLRGLTLKSPIAEIWNSNFLVAPADMKRDLVIQLMRFNRIHQIPIVDEFRKVIGLHVWEDINLSSARQNYMVIMAGGLGVRLKPYTLNCPKPMIKVAGKPMLEHIINRARSDGFVKIILSLGYLSEIIEEYFEDGTRFGVQIQYVRENLPLGTAGALSLIKVDNNEPILVTNGDVITDINYGNLLDFHIKHDATATMAVANYEWTHPFGVVNTSGLKINGFQEKPVFTTLVNAGVYVLSNEAINTLLPNVYCDMPDLFENLRVNNGQIYAYPIHEQWMDVGRPSDLDLANNQLSE